MNPEIKAKWVAALRSGEYQQGKAHLQTGDGKFCCLGVLCDLYRKETGHGYWTTYYNDKAFNLPGESTSPYYPPLEINKWVERETNWVKVSITINGLSRPIAEHNDGGATFTQIADALEEQM
jgi:hypothetical protein